MSWNSKVLLLLLAKEGNFFLWYNLNFQWNFKVNLLIHATCFTVETFQGPIQLQGLVPLAISLDLWSNQWDWISVMQGSLVQAKDCLGIWPRHSSFRCSGVLRGRWLPDWWSSHLETGRVKGNRAPVGECAPWTENYGPLVPLGKVNAFHIIFYWSTVFWECPNNFKMTFLCGLMFLICYNLHYISTCLNQGPDGIHSGQASRQLLFRG